MSEPDRVSEFLKLRRKHKTGQLTPVEAERWKALKKTLTEPSKRPTESPPVPLLVDTDDPGRRG